VGDDDGDNPFAVRGPATTRFAAELVSTAAMATYAYDQIDQARTELKAVSK
jgi:hypothetical protein